MSLLFLLWKKYKRWEIIRIHRILFSKVKTKGHDVIGVNVLLRKIMRLLHKKGVNSGPISLLHLSSHFFKKLFKRKFHSFFNLDWEQMVKPSYNCERFEPRSHFKSRLSLIVQVNVVLYRTVVVDSDWRLDNLCDSHLQSQSEFTSRLIIPV